LQALHAQVCARRGDVARARAALQAAERLDEASPSHVLRIMLATAQGEIGAAQGDRERAIERLELAYDLAHESGHVELLLEIAELLIDAMVRDGQGKRAREAIGYALDLAQRYAAHAHLDRIRLAQCHLNAA